MELGLNLNKTERSTPPKCKRSLPLFGFECAGDFTFDSAHVPLTQTERSIQNICYFGCVHLAMHYLSASHSSGHARPTIVSIAARFVALLRGSAF